MGVNVAPVIGTITILGGVSPCIAIVKGGDF